MNMHSRQVFALLLASAFFSQQMQAGGPPAALPSGGAFTAGSGAITATSNAVTINQSSTRAIIDWNNFSIGNGGVVRFNNGSGATLNRVTGNEMSSILGSLISSGSVYLINPEGILIGPGAHVNTGGDFAASTLNISNSDFLSGTSYVFTGNSHAVVANLGDISNSGSIFLIGHDVSNGGKLTAANGTVGLAAGSEVLLKDSTGDQRVFVQAPGGNITNTGQISAAQAELKTKGGNIYALAGNNGGVINATGTAKINGEAWLVANGGTTTITGTISAQNASGRGGNVETSGENLDISHASVKTGQGGNWLLDPVDVLIDSRAATTIQNSLGTTNVTVQTTSTGASGPGTQTQSGNGDITVGSSIAWASNNSLTLSAYRNIGVTTGVTISSTGSGNLTLYADNAATGTGSVAFAGTGKLTFTGSGNANLYSHSPSSYSGNYTMGTGAFTSYATVDTQSDLQNINSSLSTNYALNTDLNLGSAPNFSPIGTSGGLAGIFDGQSHTITGLR